MAKPYEPRTHRVKHAASRRKISFAREQRHEPTDAEAVLWEALRRRALGVRFRRQHPIGDFVMDFYCERIQLAVEVDGLQHAQPEGYDRWRTEQLAKYGIRAIRVWAHDVVNDLPGVLRQIREALRHPPPVAGPE